MEEEEWPTRGKDNKRRDVYVRERHTKGLEWIQRRVRGEVIYNRIIIVPNSRNVTEYLLQTGILGVLTQLA